MYLVAIGWLYVVLMVALVEATDTKGGWLGALFTFVFYGLLPLGLVLYVMGSPGRRRARREAEEASTRLDPDGSRHAPAVAVEQPVAPEREEP